MHVRCLLLQGTEVPSEHSTVYTHLVLVHRGSAALFWLLRALMHVVHKRGGKTSIHVEQNAKKKKNLEAKNKEFKNKLWCFSCTLKCLKNARTAHRDLSVTVAMSSCLHDWRMSCCGNNCVKGLLGTRDLGLFTFECYTSNIQLVACGWECRHRICVDEDVANGYVRLGCSSA